MGRLIDAEKLWKHITSIYDEGLSLDELKSEIDEISTSERCGNYECFHCLSQGVIWDADFDFEDFGYEGEGIVHICHCANCGAEIEYRIPLGEEEDDD